MEKEFENKRKIIAIVLVLIAIIIIIALAESILGNKSKFNNEENKLVESNSLSNINYVIIVDGIKENNSEKIKAEQKIKYFIISNVKIVYENEISKLTAEILNNGKDTKNLKIKAIFLGNDSKMIAEKEIEVGNINKGETKNISIELQEDISNAKLVRYEIVN